MNYIIEAKDICLKYHVIKGMNIKNFFLNMVKRNEDRDDAQPFYAISDLSFNIEKGKTVGLIGGNGAGKSTLLRMLANVFQPDSGQLQIRTDSVSLLTLGTGFMKELPGIDNIYMNASLFGLRKQDIEEKLDEIIEFSELGDFIYSPIRTYSSGMKSKLAFSIAAHIEPELLLIDEVFSVGDIHFRKKSEAKIRQMIAENRTVIMVSHSLGLIEELSDHVLWLHKGKMMEFGDPKTVVTNFKKFVE